MINEIENLNHIISDFVVKCFNLKIIDYDYNLISFDSNEIFKFNYDKLMNKKNMQLLYAEILENISTNFCIDFIFSFTNTLMTNYNTIFSFQKNRPVFYLTNQDIRKKRIHNLNELLLRIDHASTNSETNMNIMFPFICNIDETTLDKISNWINILNKLMKIERVIILSFFQVNLSYIQKLEELIKNTNLNIIHIKLVDKEKFFTILKKNEIISLEKYNKINMFLNPTETKINNLNKVSNNPLTLKWKSIIAKKQSRICISVEHIKEYEEMIKFTNLVGNYISAIKINSNFIFNESILSGLKRLAEHHNFIIIDDKQLILKNISQLKKLNVYNYVDIVSINLEFMNEEIEEWFKQQRKSNPMASFIINLYNENDFELAKKQYEYFNNYIFGFIGVKETSNKYFSIIEYSDLNYLNDEFKTLQNTDMVVLGDELNKSKNPLDVLQKINKIMTTE